MHQDPLLRPAGSAYADAEAAHLALAMALPTIERARQDRRICGTGCLCLVVMDPALSPADGSFEAAVLLQHDVDRAAWDADYAMYARAKARTAWLRGRDGLALSTREPHRLRPGDSLLAGAVELDGLIVACSGAEPCWDEALALTVAAILRAVARERLAAALAAGEAQAG